MKLLHLHCSHGLIRGLRMRQVKFVELLLECLFISPIRGLGDDFKIEDFLKVVTRFWNNRYCNVCWLLAFLSCCFFLVFRYGRNWFWGVWFPPCKDCIGLQRTSKRSWLLCVQYTAVLLCFYDRAQSIEAIFQYLILVLKDGLPALAITQESTHIIAIWQHLKLHVPPCRWIRLQGLQEDIGACLHRLVGCTLLHRLRVLFDTVAKTVNFLRLCPRDSSQ